MKAKDYNMPHKIDNFEHEFMHSAIRKHAKDINYSTPDPSQSFSLSNFNHNLLENAEFEHFESGKAVNKELFGVMFH